MEAEGGTKLQDVLGGWKYWRDEGQPPLNKTHDIEGDWVWKKGDQPSLNETRAAGSDWLKLQNVTELSYVVPANTTLLRVLGPVADAFAHESDCYASLSPDPSWWRRGNFPIASQYRRKLKPGLVNRTMFILPVDPAVQHTLQVGSPRPFVACRISGIQSYPLH